MPITPPARWQNISVDSLNTEAAWSWAEGPLKIPPSDESHGLMGTRIICTGDGARLYRGGLSRCAVYAYKLKPTTIFTASSSPPIILEAWAWSAGTATLVVTADLPTVPWGDPGLLLGVSGVLCDGWEIRARVELGAAAQFVEGFFRLIVDRSGEPAAAVSRIGAALTAGVQVAPL